VSQEILVGLFILRLMPSRVSIGRLLNALGGRPACVEMSRLGLRLQGLLRLVMPMTHNEKRPSDSHRWANSIEAELATLAGANFVSVRNTRRVTLSGFASRTKDNHNLRVVRVLSRVLFLTPPDRLKGGQGCP